MKTRWEVWKCWVSRITRFSQSSAWSLLPPLSIVSHLCTALVHSTCAPNMCKSLKLNIFFTEIFLHWNICALNMCTAFVQNNLNRIFVHWICALLLCTAMYYNACMWTMLQAYAMHSPVPTSTDRKCALVPTDVKKVLYPTKNLAKTCA